MGGVFVKDSDLVTIDFYFQAGKTRTRVITEKEYNNLPACDQNEYQSCQVQVKPLTWGKTTDLQRRAKIMNMELGQKVFDTDIYITEKLKAIIMAWSFTEEGEDGKEVPVPLSSENIDRLNPMIADFILEQYRERCELNEEEEKNF